MTETRHNLYFVSSSQEYRLLAEDIEEKAVPEYIRAFLEDHNYTSYYTRITFAENGLWYDVGSHTEFFYWGTLDEV